MDADFYERARGSRIVIYHGICQQDHTRFNPIFLTLDIFEAHLRYYKKYFNIVSLDEFYQQKFSRDKFNICLTFDDGFANNYKYVLPLLEKYEIPATFFITAIRHAGYDILWDDFLNIASKYGPGKILYKNQFFGKNRYGKYYSLSNGKKLSDILREQDFNVKAEMMELLHFVVPFKYNQDEYDYWLQMDEVQIKKLAKSPYVTIGSHGYYHNDMANISPGDNRYEMQVSKQYLENLIQQQVSSFAFPYGSYTRQMIDVAKQTGYDKLLTMDFLYPEDELDCTMSERFTINPFISPNNQMHATIKKKYEA